MAAQVDATLIAELCLTMVQGIGPRLRQRLAQAFGSAEEILAQTPTQLAKVEGVGGTLAGRIAEANLQGAQAELRRADKHGICIFSKDDPRYPAALKQIHDPPPMLFVRGETRPTDALAVAIVGTRHATQYGIQQAERLAAGLAAKGLVVVSGMARGIDTAAHRGAIQAGGRTIAVLAGGLLRPYPPENAGLALEIAEHGCVVSEAPLLRPPMSGAFPQRNRIISGMTLGTVVVEAADRSGSLITARHACEQGREVFAVPGPVDSRLSRGCHSLIKDGAKLVGDVDDVLEELGPLIDGVPREQGGQVRSVAELALNEAEQTVIQSIDTSPTPIDRVIEQTKMPAHQVLAIISVLEMRRLVRRVSGALVARV